MTRASMNVRRKKKKTSEAQQENIREDVIPHQGLSKKKERDLKEKEKNGEPANDDPPTTGVWLGRPRCTEFPTFKTV